MLRYVLIVYVVFLAENVHLFNVVEWNDGYDNGQAIPKDVIVNVINNFGLELLQAHNENNNNNIALSPYGAASVLIAISEGVAGSGNEEIYRTLRLPRDKSVVRIGLRDVHRHLKSYFIPKEGFLAGLTLSNDNVTLTNEFEDILKFYGYDIESFNSALYPDYEQEGDEITTIPSIDNVTGDTTTTQRNRRTTTTSSEEDETITTDEMLSTLLTTSTVKATTTQSSKDDEKKQSTTTRSTTSKRTTTTMETKTPTTKSQLSTATTKPITSATTTKFKMSSTTTKPKMSSTTTTKPKMTTTTTTRQMSPTTTKSKMTTTTTNPKMTATTTKKQMSATTTKIPTSTTSIPEELSTKQITTEPTTTDAATTEIPTTITTTEALTTQREETTTQELSSPLVLTRPIPTTTERMEIDGNLNDEVESAGVNDRHEESTTTTTAENLSTLPSTSSGTTPILTDSITDTTLKDLTITMSSTMEAATAMGTTFPMKTSTMKTSTMETSTMEASTMKPSPMEISTMETSTIDTSTMDISTMESSTMDTSAMETSTIELSKMETSTMEPSTMETISTTIVSTMPDVTTQTEVTTTKRPVNQKRSAKVKKLRKQSVKNVTNLSRNSKKNTRKLSRRNEIKSQKMLSSNERGSLTTSMKMESATVEKPVKIGNEQLTMKVALKEKIVSRSMSNKSSSNAKRNNTTSSAITLNKEHQNVRRKRSVVDYVIARYYDNYHVNNNNNQNKQSMDYVVDKEHFSFLINGNFRLDNINYMTYDTILPFSFVPNLNAIALGFPLDNIKYYLLLLLPVEDDGIDKLIYNLNQIKNLNEIIGNLKYARVKATIPSFMLKGYVVLTPTLQKLGINRIFEPRQADFTPMTNEKDTYVTNIEQAITVTIRNYVDPKTLMNNHRNLHQYGIVEFKADHPFLYFVIDSDIHVTLMAGKIVNPLNSRIR